MTAHNDDTEGRKLIYDVGGCKNHQKTSEAMEVREDDDDIDVEWVRRCQRQRKKKKKSN